MRVLVTLRIGYEPERKQCHVTQSNIFQTPLTIYESFRALSTFSENTEGKLSEFFPRLSFFGKQLHQS